MAKLRKFVAMMFIASFLGCGGDLPRAEAARLIKQHLRLPATRTERMYFFYSKRTWSDPVRGFGTVTVCVDDGPTYAAEEAKLKAWKAAGVIEMIEESGRTGHCNWVREAVGIHEDAQTKYKVKVLPQSGYYEVPVYDLDLGEIQGIVTRREQRTAEVEYTLQPTNVTPFAVGDFAPQATSHKMSFVLYDDGWRIRPEDSR